MTAIPQADGRWLIVGAAGMLGHELMTVLADRNVTGIDLPYADITDLDRTREDVRGYDIVVNCAAWTAVDAAEDHEPQAFTVNAVGAANLARACAENDAWLVQISTDYVFAGDAISPYPVDAPIAPRSAYGRTKAAGEWAVQARLPAAHYLMRTAWLYGEHGPNFVATMAKLERERETVDVVDDQRGQPTWAADLARRIVTLADSGGAPGTYHATNSGDVTWFGFAQRIFELAGADPGRVRPTTSAAFVRPAPRPAYSVLDHSGWESAGIEPMRGWRDALDAAWAAGIAAAAR